MSTDLVRAPHRTDALLASPARVAAELQAVKDLIAPEASVPELKVYAQVCSDLELNPFAGDICLIGRYDTKAQRDIYRHQITVQGRRLIAFRTGGLQGIEGPVWCGPRLHPIECRCQGSGWLMVPMADGTASGEMLRCPERRGDLDWTELWEDDDGPPYAARCLVHVAGWKVPANGTAKFSEFAQWVKPKRKKRSERSARTFASREEALAAQKAGGGDEPEEEERGDQLGPLWKKAPSHMLGKCAEALALRRGFPAVRDAVTYAGAWPGDSLAGEADDASLIAEAEAQSAVIPTGTGAGSFPGEAPTGSVSPGRPAPPPFERGSAVPAGARPPGARGRPRYDEVPPEVYDNEPEAMAYAPDDPGRPFT